MNRDVDCLLPQFSVHWDIVTKSLFAGKKWVYTKGVKSFLGWIQLLSNNENDLGGRKSQEHFQQCWCAMV